MAKALDWCSVWCIQQSQQKALQPYKSSYIGKIRRVRHFSSWKNLGGHIKKGAKSEIVVFWKIIDVEEKNDKGEIEKKKLPLLRYYNVFHISQIEGVEPLKEKLNTEIEPIEEADRIIKNYVDREQLVFNECKSNKAYYAPLIDTVVVPLKEQYSNISEYYSTTFHELVHSSGSKNRLNRLETSNLASFGSETYSKENQLQKLAQLPSLTIWELKQKEHFKTVLHTLKVGFKFSRNDNKFIVSASSKAEKAVNYILGIE